MSTGFNVVGYVAGYAPVKYGTVAALTLLMYDYALTFDAEVEYVWKRDWSFGKVIYLLNRYLGMITLIFDIFVFFHASLSFQFCQNFDWWELASEVVAIVSAEIILIIRIHAVYERKRGILFMLIGLLVAEVISSLLIVVLGMPTTITVQVKGLTGCQGNARPPHFFLCWIPALIFETILMSLMAIKSWSLYVYGTSSKLLQLIVRDSLTYFLVMFMALLANCIVWALPAKLHLDLEIAMGWAVAIPCALGSRLLLNMRERYYREKTLMLSTDAGILPWGGSPREERKFSVIWSMFLKELVRDSFL